MENRPPEQESPGRPPPDNARTTDGSSGSRTPPWLWLLLLVGFGAIFYQFVPNIMHAPGLTNEEVVPGLRCDPLNF